MTRDEFAQMVDWLEDLWGTSNAWVGAARLYDTFAELDTDQVYACLLARRDGDPEKAGFPPKPAELRALTLARMRWQMKPAELPETTERYGIAEWLEKNHPGKTINEVLEERAKELAK